MPHVNLTNDEYHRLMTERTNAALIGGYCEDYPCCGHTEQDPCRREWYDHPDAFNPRVNPHALCEHESGICDVDDSGEPLDPDDCGHHNRYQTAMGGWCCDDCLSELMVVTCMEQHFFESKVVPGVRLDIPILDTRMEVRW